MSTTRVSADLAAIIDMAARLQQRAVDRAGANGMPGGEAMVNLAHVANLATWERRNELAGDALLEYEDPDEMWPAYQQLRYWSEQWREQLRMDHDDPHWRPDLDSEAAFLRNPDVLTWAYEHELHWDNFASDVATAKTKLENVLVEGERPDRLRVSCPDCLKAIAQAAEEDPENTDPRRTAPRLIAVYGATRNDDRWKCPTCRHRFTADEVRQAGAAQMRTAGVTERWITLAEAVSIIRRHGGWRERTIRAWAADGTEVASTLSKGVRTVWWPDMWRAHLLHRWEVNEAHRAAQERAVRRSICEREHGDNCWIHRRGCSRILAQRAAV